jgi:hypothetical protein
MRSLLRGSVGIALGLFAALALAGPAVAAPSPAPSDECARQAAGYAAAGVCQVTVAVAAPICDNDAPMLRYQVVPEGTTKTTVTVTWVNPSGANVVYANQPLSGTVLWPGSVIGSDGKGLDWPGWTKQADGSWVQGDAFNWVIPSAQVLFNVGPQATVTVAYPPSTPVCLTSPSRSDVLAAEPNVGTSTGSGVLSMTGANSEPVLLLAGGLVLVGAGALVARRMLRRRRSA